jgi:hypothetical protein
VAKSLTLSGARAVLYIAGKKAGVFSSVSSGVNIGATPITPLGSYNPGEIVYTDMSEISVNVSGFRVLNNGPHIIGSVPHLQDLLNHEDIYIALVDRQNPASPPFATITGVRPTGYSFTGTAKGLFDLNVSFMGLLLEAEDSPQNDPTAVIYG